MGDCVTVGAGAVAVYVTVVPMHGVNEPDIAETVGATFTADNAVIFMALIEQAVTA
jgi:hypothetical protein